VLRCCAEQHEATHRAALEICRACRRLGTRCCAGLRGCGWQCCGMMMISHDDLTQHNNHCIKHFIEKDVQEGSSAR
jgi:hypothetical protein